MDECLAKWQDVREQLITLWDVIEMPEEHRQTVLQRCSQHTPSAISQVSATVMQRNMDSVAKRVTESETGVVGYIFIHLFVYLLEL